MLLKNHKSDPKIESLLNWRLFQTLVFPVGLGDRNACNVVERFIVGKVIESLVKGLGAVFGVDVVVKHT